MAIEPQYISRTNYPIPTDPVWRLSIGQYHQMILTGILTDEDSVELLEGWLIPKMPKNPPHRLTTQLTREMIAPLLPEGWFVDSQEPITIDDSEPEPDVVVVRGERRQYSDRHPLSHEIALVIEVSDTTLQRDRNLKKRLYARAGIPVYWIINLVDNQIEIYTSPSGRTEFPDYGQQQFLSPTDEVELVIEGDEIGRFRVTEVLP